VRISAEQLQKHLAVQGFKFTKLSLEQEGQFSTHDADWNYKDIPHLNEVHKQVEGVPVVIEHDLISNFFLQRIGPLRVPLSVTNYSTSSNSQVYYTSAFFFVLIIETKWTSIDLSTTRVVTTYRIGSQRFWRWSHPLISFLLRKNYKVLMSADVPMRLQRGKLRSRGLSFRGDTDGYSFLNTLNIHQDNLVLPSAESQLRSNSVLSSDLSESMSHTFIGSDDHLGIQIRRADGGMYAFPRVCPHEGAPLDEAQFAGHNRTSIRCPWHGRRIAGVQLKDGESIDVGVCQVALSGNTVRVEIR